MFKKLYDWICNCKSRPPRAGDETTNRCNREAGGFGENPMQGLGCTEPPIDDVSDLFPVIDPPQCFGGDGPCDPMPTLYRVAFPCHVPGSTCQTEPYLGAAGGCCYTIMHLAFPGAVSTVEGCEFEAADTEADSITLLPSVESPCVSTGSIALESGKTVSITLTKIPFNSVTTIDVSIGPCDPPITHRYHSGDFATCAGTFNAEDDEENTEWPGLLTVITGAGSDYDGPPIDLTPCDTNRILDMYVAPTGPAPLFPPFQDCPTCWTINPSGIGGEFGGVSETCCDNLNGSHTLCFSPKESQGDDLIFGTPCLTSSGQVVSNSQQWINCGVTAGCIPTITFPGVISQKDTDQELTLDPANPHAVDSFTVGIEKDPFTCCWYTGLSDSSSGNAYVHVPPTSPTKIGVNLLYDDGTDKWWWWGSVCTGFGGQVTVALGYGVGSTASEAFYNGLGFTGVGAVQYRTSSPLPAGVSTIPKVGEQDWIGTSDWPDTVDVEVGECPIPCAPAPYDAKRRLWQLGYNKTDMKWRLESLASIQTPVYELDDETPCVGDTKVLTKVEPDDPDSGCDEAPDTITLTRGTDDECMECNSYVEPGCQVQLVRQCGSTNYALRHTSAVSADPKLSHICAQTRGNNIKQCCDVGCNYTPDTSGDPPCCSVQKVMYTSNNDPWFDPSGSVDIWRLDLDADPIQLIGDFAEGQIVYEVDSNGLQCGTTPTQLYLASSTLPDNLKVLYPTNVCMVGDKLLTCNVRRDLPEYADVDENFLGGPCDNAGYDPETGQEDFCDCNDSCAPVLAGSITVGDCSSDVCAARTIAPQMDPDAKSQFSYVACARIFNEGTERYDVLVQVIYCVGPGARWASDWYCAKGQPEDVEANTFRICRPCSTYWGGDFLGTTYANRDECSTLPFFEQPVPPDRPEGYSGCVCGPPCCSGTTLPTTVHVSDGTVSVPLTGIPGGWSGGGSTYPLCGLTQMGLAFSLGCDESSPSGWKLILNSITYGITTVYPATVNCDPFELSATLPAPYGCSITITA